MRFEAGAVFAGYTVVSRLGRGGTATVYLVREPGLDRLVALKVLPDNLVDDAMFAPRFEQEARLIASLDHPNIIPLYRYGIDDDTPWMALRYVDGGDFSARLKAGPLSNSEGLAILRGVASALDYAHSKGVIHRDLKPQNILLTSQGAPYLADFGIAKLLEGAESTKTATGSVFGTPAYMAPEQATHGAIGPHTDVYALAVICFRWLTGRLPFEADSPHVVLLQHVQEPPPREAMASLPPGAVAVLERGLAKNPQHRYRTAGQLVSALEDALQSFSTTQVAAPVGATTMLQTMQTASTRSTGVTLQEATTVTTLGEGASNQPRRRLVLSLAALLAVVAAGLVAWWAVRAPATGTVLLDTNGDCRLSVDNGAKGILHAGSSLRLDLPPGAHLVQCTSTQAGSVVVAQSSTVTAGQQAVLVIDMQARLAQAAKAGQVALAAPDHSIAVLPFVDLSQKKDQGYFSDGIAEELLNQLARIPELKVSARTSSFSFKGKEVEVPAIARQLHVAHVLEGSVRKSGDRVRINTQLIRAADGFEMWSQAYDRKFHDIFAIEDEIAADVVKELKLKLLRAVPKTRTTDPRAYGLYLQAKQLARQFTPDALAKSDALYRQVVAIDPRYAPAWVEMAHNFVNEANIGVLPSKEAFKRAREAAEKALKIDPDYASAHAVLGVIAMYGDNDLAGAAKQFERALALDPGDADVLRSSAALLGNLGRAKEAVKLDEYAVSRDPVNAAALHNLGVAQLWAGQLDAAIASYRKVLALRPGQGVAHFQLGVALLLKGDAPGALAEIEQEPAESWRLLGLSIVYSALGKKADSDTALAELTQKYGKDAAYNIAYVYAFRGEADKAFEWLDKEIEYNGPGMSQIVVEPLFDKIHSDPRWLPFLQRIGKAPEQLAKIEFNATLPPEVEQATAAAPKASP